MALTLKTKFAALAVAAVTATIATVVINYLTDHQVSALSEKQALATQVIQRHMDADMMHDGMRGNVYSALVAARLGDTELLKASQDEVAEMSITFAKNVEENIASDIPADIKLQLQTVRKSVEAYVDYSHKISIAAADFDTATRMLPEFNRIFGLLEDDQEKASDLILNWSENIKHDLETTADRAGIVMLVLGIFTIILTLIVPFFAVHSLFRPLNNMTATMHQLAEGDKSVEVPYTNRHDEMGDVAKSVQVFKENALRIDKLSEEQKMRDKIVLEQKRAATHQLASQFEANVKNVVDMVASAATEMDATSKSVSKMAEVSGDKLKMLTTQIDGTTRNVQTVSTATAQLSGAISEISQQVARATTITTAAVQESQKADATVQSLSQAADKIGEVLGLINSITGQINLLALNATIEAARAGDAGKGFAVVASEVKSLAGQTTKATEEISLYITSIQAATTNTVEVIKNIGNTIREINGISTTIAAAVEEQGAATKDIAHNVQQAADSTSEVSRNSEDVAITARDTGAAAHEMMGATTELSRQAETLRKEVDKFLDGVRAS